MSVIIIKLTFFMSLIYLVGQILRLGHLYFKYHEGIAPFVLFLAVPLGVIFATLIYVTFRNLHKSLQKEYYKPLTKVETIACGIQLTSTFLLFLFTLEIYRVMEIVYYLGFLLFLLGVITYMKFRNRINIANACWGIYTILLMQLTFLSVYGTLL